MLVVLDKVFVLLLKVTNFLFKLFDSVVLVLDLGVASFQLSLLALGFNVDFRLRDVRSGLLSCDDKLSFERSDFFLRDGFFPLNTAFVGETN